MTQTNDIQLNRLSIKQKDGSRKVVGYQKQEGGVIYHFHSLQDINKNSRMRSLKSTGEFSYIPHDRADRFVLTLEDGTSVFERDTGEFQGLGKDTRIGRVEFYKGGFYVIDNETGNIYFDIFTATEYRNFKPTGMVGEVKC